MKILFVCIGNTCRSPMAETIMKYWIKKYNLDWEVNSRGLRDWNVGRKPEKRCLKVLRENNLSTKHLGDVIKLADFSEYDYILGMDENNIKELENLFCLAKPKHPGSKIELLGSYIGRNEDNIINDPYFSTGLGGFRCCFSQINQCCVNFIENHK